MSTPNGELLLWLFTALAHDVANTREDDEEEIIVPSDSLLRILEDLARRITTDPSFHQDAPPVVAARRITSPQKRASSEPSDPFAFSNRLSPEDRAAFFTDITAT